MLSAKHVQMVGERKKKNPTTFIYLPVYSTSLIVFTGRYKVVFKQMCVKTYLKEFVSIISLNYQNMDDEVGGYDVKHI